MEHTLESPQKDETVTHWLWAVRNTLGELNLVHFLGVPACGLVKSYGAREIPQERRKQQSNRVIAAGELRWAEGTWVQSHRDHDILDVYLYVGKNFWVSQS